ncbi:MAG: enoyl-CoA hydratase/isomerase family protein [Planctomycetota bacterium]
MSDLQHHRLEKSEGVARLVLARPKHNVLNIEMMRELNSILEGLLADRELKALIISADGPSFSAGVDVGEHSPNRVREMIAVFNRIFELLQRFEVPTLAAVQGRALGGGMELCIACDIVVAARSALFGQPEIKLGFFPPYAAMRLPQLVGPARAIEICCTGMSYQAEEAERMGLVSHVVDDDKLLEEVERIASELKACSPLIIRLNKRAVTEHGHRDFASASRGVTDLFLGTLMRTEDTLEGLKSFAEKRKPVWRNR